MKDKTTGHINYWGALALRSRVHLYMDNADGTDHNALALKDAKEVIENSPYKLYSIGDYLSFGLSNSLHLRIFLKLQ